jgi:molecular chaperone GrpE
MIFWSKKVGNKGQQDSDNDVSDESVIQEQGSEQSAPTDSDSNEIQNDTAELAEHAAEAAAEAAEDIVEAEVTLEHLQQELEAARDAAMRAHAEAQNARRRSDQDVEKARKYALDRFAGELLPVVDNLERALEATAGDQEILKPIAEGVELTLKSFRDALKKFNVEMVDPEGEPFDPQFHQAMSMVENAEVEPNTVIAVMQKGYTLNGRLVRPAMVMVSKSPG